MAENPSNGHAPDGQSIANGAAPVVPRIAAPQGARSARAFDGTPIILEETLAPDEIPASDATIAIEEISTRDDDERLKVHDSDDSRDDDARLKVHDSDVLDQNSRESDARLKVHDGEEVADYRRDFEENFAGENAAPLGISLEKDEPQTNEFEAFAPDFVPSDDYAQAGLDVTGAEIIEGEQLFADDGAGGEPPSDNNALATSGASGRPDTPHDQEAGLFEHLAELRSRIIYAMLGVMLVMCLTWKYALEIQGWFSAPITRVLHANGGKGTLISTDPTAFFTLQFQSSLLAALLLAAPWVLFQVWRFIEPALTNSERRYTLVLVPFSSILFFLGAALGYFCAPLFFQFFLQFQPPGVAAQWKYDESVILMAKMLLIFGLAFQVPIVIIFGNKIGLVSRNLLIEYWRHAVVVIFIVVAIVTPTWDPFTMTACALPPCLLYLLSIWLVKWL